MNAAAGAFCGKQTPSPLRKRRASESPPPLHKLAADTEAADDEALREYYDREDGNRPAERRPSKTRRSSKSTTSGADAAAAV
jgi:hypothetical protein